MGEVIYAGRDEIEESDGTYELAKNLYAEYRQPGEPEWMELTRDVRLHFYRIAFEKKRNRSTHPSSP